MEARCTICGSECAGRQADKPICDDCRGQAAAVLHGARDLAVRAARKQLEEKAPTLFGVAKALWQVAQEGKDR